MKQAINLEKYLKDPCKASSLPYWKTRALAIPNNVRVVHRDSFNGKLLPGQTQQVFFRLKHDLVLPTRPSLPSGFSFQLVNHEDRDDLLEIVKIINASYKDIKVNTEQVQSWRDHSVFRQDLWVFVQDESQQKKIAASGEVHYGLGRCPKPC